MGPDEKEVKNFVMCPINPDGSFGEPVELEKLKVVELDELEFGTNGSDNLIYKDSCKFLSTTISGTLKCNLPRKMSRKKFKKWLMSRGINRYYAEWFCKAITSFHGKKSYRSLYLYGHFASTPQTLFNNLFDALFPITNNKETKE